MTPTEWKDLWACPLMPVKAFADALGVTEHKVKKVLEAVDAPIFSVGGVDWVKPIDIGHSARGWRASE